MGENIIMLKIFLTAVLTLLLVIRYKLDIDKYFCINVFIDFLIFFMLFYYLWSTL